MIAAADSTLEGLFIIAFLIGLYWLPTIIAFNRDVANQWSIAIINLFLGWTLIGWVVALAMSVRDTRSKAVA